MFIVLTKSFMLWPELVTADVLPTQKSLIVIVL